ncbi:type IV secretion system protein [Nocardioidaceae bacterium]|nr:type IV secretion system protein [Nocardioidaceae bacterium]
MRPSPADLLPATSTSVPAVAVEPRAEGLDCDWWNLVCQGGQQVADSGFSAITSWMVTGLVALFGQITKIVDESTRVPLGDPVYRDTYYGFAQLAVPLIAIIYIIALLVSAVHHDLRAVTRATVGLIVACIGSVVYVIFAQLLVSLDDWLAHGIVATTGADFGEQMGDLTDKFDVMGDTAGGLAANALMLILMAAALVAGIVLWVVLLLRKMAILVVVAFAPILIAGWLWAPTRSWSRKATEVLVALVFAKSVIYMVFGIGMSLLLRGNQSLSDFVGVVVLLCGACLAPLVMLRLVHFAADSHVAGDMVATLRSGAQPTMAKVAAAGHVAGAPRQRMAADYASTARTSKATTLGGGTAGSSAGTGAAGPRAAGATNAGAARAAGSGAAGSSSAGAAGAGAGAAASAAVPVAGAAVMAAGAVKQKNGAAKANVSRAVRSTASAATAGSGATTGPASSPDSSMRQTDGPTAPAPGPTKEN